MNMINTASTLLTSVNIKTADTSLTPMNDKDILHIVDHKIDTMIGFEHNNDRFLKLYVTVI